MNPLATLNLLEILYMNNATLLPKQAEELACNDNIMNIECIGKAYRHCILYKYILINGNAINIYARIPQQQGGI